MNKDKYVFAQLIEFLDNNKFRHLVDKYDGNRYVKHFTYKYKDEKAFAVAVGFMVKKTKQDIEEQRT